MTDTELTTTTEDAAWASFNTPLNTASLLNFCQDIERLLRINPYLEFEKWETIDDNKFVIRARNLSQDPALTMDTEIQVEHPSNGIRLLYNNGLKSSTTFKIEEAAEGTRLTIADDYTSVSEYERNTRLGEVDKSLVKWAEDLQRYLVLWKRWSRLAPWRWYMKRVWQPMKPAARRITYMLLWISVAEIALITLGIVIYFVEYNP